MEDDGSVSVDGSTGESLEMTILDKQKASLKTYRASLPYETESYEEMQQKLEAIVGKIFVCAKAKNWIVLSTWDGLLQCWLLMRYPIPKSTRAKLARLYYELCILPGIEARVMRSWADMLSRLLSSKPGMSRKLDPEDLQLPWRPLWDALQKEVWPKKRVHETTRNMLNLLLFVAELCKRYFPASQIPHILETFIPLITQDSFLTMLPILTSFLPQTHTHLYVPVLFKFWEAFNSHTLDDRMLELAGELSEAHVAGKAGEAGEGGGAEWRDVGIWTQSQWDLIIWKGLSSMSIPVGTMSITASHADSMINGPSQRIKKSINRFAALALVIVYSIAADGPARDTSGPTPDKLTDSAGFVAGSKALETLDRLITSIESFFHPSNSGNWAISLTTFLHRLTCEYLKRQREEELETCKIPTPRRLTPEMRRAFVRILRTPALLAMFSKDSVAIAYAQGSLRNLAHLEPNLVLPELLERAYSGLEVVNETHRTTAVLNMLSGIARPLVTERLWLGGQKHLVPLLELCIPGIDLNDPTKTVCATMFIVSAIQHIKIGDLSASQSALPVSGDQTVEMNVDGMDHMPDGTGYGFDKVLSRDEERVLVRDSTAGFADWVTSLFRRVFALYENLPEEGGRKNTTGGKQEEAMLKSIKSMLDVVCLHLSDPLFDLVLNQVYNYATTNAKSNAVKAFGQLVACLARVKPDQVIKRFLPFCKRTIEEELRHGASSVRTTSVHAAIPSDTTLHWNMAVLRGCLGYGGKMMLKYRQEVFDLLLLLVEKTKGERGYSSTGRLITRVLHTLTGVYPYNSRFVNTNEWEDLAFDHDHNAYWGKLYLPEDVHVEWHVPSDEEIDFAIEILDRVAGHALDQVERLLESPSRWDNIGRNDFCRYLTAVRSAWLGLPTFIKEQPKTVPNPCLYEVENLDLLVAHLDVKAGFTLTNPEDPRYQKVAAHRTRFGEVARRAAQALRNGSGSEDHIDAVIAVTRSIDTYLLEYGMNRHTFDSFQKAYTQARDMNRMWIRQRDNSRLVMVRRAQVYHSGRVYMHALYRRRSELDDKLLMELVELSLSPYTRIRRQAQSVFHDVCSYYVRATRFSLSTIFKALEKGNDPDRMKGALYIMWNKGFAAYAMSDLHSRETYLTSLLECQHEEKPSIQKVVGNIAEDCLTHLNEETYHTDAYILGISRLDDALEDLRAEFSPSLVDRDLLQLVLRQSSERVAIRNANFHSTVQSILSIATRPTTHWRYIQMATRFLAGLIRRDVPTLPDVARFLLEQATSPQPSIRIYAQRAVVKLLTFVKMRTYAESNEQLWRDQWRNPLVETVPISNSSVFRASLHQPINSTSNFYVDKIETGFVAWTSTIKAYRSVIGQQWPIIWENESQQCLSKMREVLHKEFFRAIAALWSQESKSSGSVEMRSDNLIFFKSLAKTFDDFDLDDILDIIDPLLVNSDNYKQRAGAEILAGIVRGSKHWPVHRLDKLWDWIKPRLDGIFAQIKPDTLSFWEGIFSSILQDRDPRRSQILVNWLQSLPLEFNGDSAFAMSKSLTLFVMLTDILRSHFNPRMDYDIKLLLEHANTAYAEMRTHLCQSLYMLMRNQWEPVYPTVSALLEACQTERDPLHIRNARYLDSIQAILDKLPEWRDQRLPPPRVSQSQYDKVGLTLLQWIWYSAHGAQASLMFPYVLPMMPEILHMSELNDSSDLQNYSSAVLNILSSVSPPFDYVEPIIDRFVTAVKSSKSWRIRLHALPALVVFFYRNLLTITISDAGKVMDVLLDCLSDENVEVREAASKVLAGVIRCSQRQSIVPLKNRFVELARRTSLPPRRDPNYANQLRVLHSAVLGLCALIESVPYSVEPWMPPLTEILALHAADPPPISTTIRKCASEFKKTHQDTWHKDQHMFDEDQLQSLSTMLVGTSYYA